MTTDPDPRIPWSARASLHDRRRWARYRAQLVEVAASRWMPIPEHKVCRPVEEPAHRSRVAVEAYEAPLALDAGVPVEALAARRALLEGDLT